MHPLLTQLAPEVPIAPIASLGIGGALAALMFWFYRHDRKEFEERYAKLGENFKTMVQENTAANVRLADVIERVLNSRAATK